MVTRILGLNRLKKKIERLKTEVAADLRKAMEQGASEVVALAKSLVSVDSGLLRDSIGWTWGDAPKGSMPLGQIKGRGADGAMRITIYAGNSAAYYARWLEFGTSGHINGGLFAGSQHPGVRARPFFFVSWRANRKRVKSRITRTINKAAKRVAAGG